MTSPIIPNFRASLDAVADLGLDPTGTKDIGAPLNAFLAANIGKAIPPIMFPMGPGGCAGRYLIETPIVVKGSHNTGNNLVFIGAGRAAYNGYGSVQFLVDTPDADGLWLNNCQPTSGSEYGPRIEHITFVDVTKGPQRARSGLRITQYNNLLLNDLSFVNFTGNTSKVGMVAVENGKCGFLGIGTAFTPQMQFGHLQIGGKFQEIASINTSPAGILTSAWQMPSGTYPYSIGYNGIGLLLEGTSASGFTQYGRCSDILGFNNRCWIDVAGSATSVAGVSRIQFDGCRYNGNHQADSIGVFLGKFSDTVYLNGMAQNNVAFGVVIEGGHGHLIKAQLENNGAWSPVSTLNGGVGEQAGVRGVVINADNAGRVKNNVISDAYIYNFGNAFEFWSPTVLEQIIANNRLDANLHNYAWADGSFGPPTKPAAGVPVALIQQFDYQGTK